MEREKKETTPVPSAIPSIVVDNDKSATPPPGKHGRRDSVGPDPEKLRQRRGSKPLPEDEDEEISQYFDRKPENQVVKLGETMKVDCTFKKAPPHVDWYRGAIPVKTDPRCTILFDEKKLTASMELKKCKLTDEFKFRVQIEDAEQEEVIEFAGFSVFVKMIQIGVNSIRLRNSTRSIRVTDACQPLTCLAV